MRILVCPVHNKHGLSYAKLRTNIPSTMVGIISRLSVINGSVHESMDLTFQKI